MGEALGHRGYILLTAGFFVCGFQVVFLAVHLPAYLADKGLPAYVAVTALALIGLFNIVGTYHCRMAGRQDAEEVHPVGNLLRTRCRVRALLLDTGQRVQRLRLRHRAGIPVAVDRACDQRRRRADLRRPLPGDAVGIRVPSRTRSAASLAPGWAANSTT